MSRQRLRAIERRIDKIITGPYPQTPGDRARELIELDTLLNEIGVILFRRLKNKAEHTCTEKALYYYLSGKVR